MRLLLDTHALLWWWNEGAPLGSQAKAAMGDVDNDVFVSAASAWEIATKVRKGQLPEFGGNLSAFAQDVERDGFKLLDIAVRRGIAGGSLAGPHKDPFDRLIAAQALLEDLVVVTRDAEIAAFGCKVLW